MAKPTLVVTSRYPKEVEDRIERDYNARRNPNQGLFSQQYLLSAAEGADALFITPADRLDSAFFQKVSATVKVIATFSVGFEHIDLEAAARDFVAEAANLDQFGCENTFFGVFDAFIEIGSNGKTHRESTLILQITPPGAPAAITKYLMTP